MKYTVVIILIFGCFVLTNLSAVVLPGNWDRGTCKITTGDTLGTGFLVEYREKDFIVTNAHVVTPGKSKVHIRFRPEIEEVFSKLGYATHSAYDNQPLEIGVDSSNFFVSKKYDIALITVPVAPMYDIAFIDSSFIGHDSMIIPGRETFFLGYPNNMAGRNATVPLVRQALIAGEFEHKIILDGNFFGGSSGSPIFLNVDLENRITKPYLIGIVTEQRDIPVKKASPNVVVWENMGIGIGIKISYVIETIEDYLRQKKEK